MTLPHEQPAPSARRRAVLDGLIKCIDVSVGIIALIAGVFALVAAPPSIVREVSLPFFVVLWGVLLIAGGFSSALGRLTGIWILETAGIMGAATGALIYLAVVATAITTELGVAVAVCLILVALLALIRRYIELQIFLSEPTDVGLVARLRGLLRIRTTSALRH